MSVVVDRATLELFARARAIKAHVLGRWPEPERWAGENLTMRPAAHVDNEHVTNPASADNREAA